MLQKSMKHLGSQNNLKSEKKYKAKIHYEYDGISQRNSFNQQEIHVQVIYNHGLA
jgi:hypothetical protein